MTKTVLPRLATERTTWHTWEHVDTEGTIQNIGLKKTHSVRSLEAARARNSYRGHPYILPWFREKMDEFVRQIQQADDPQDPKILSEAFMLVSDAFLKAGHQAEATKWRRKALKMKVKLTQAISNQQTSD